MNRDRGWRPVGDDGWQHALADRDAYAAGRDQHIQQHHYYGGAPVHHRPMPTSVGVVAWLYVSWGWVGVLFSGAMTLLGIEGIASAAAGKFSLFENLIIFLLGAGRPPPGVDKIDSGRTAAVSVIWLLTALSCVLMIQWMFRMVRGLRRGDAECHTKVLNYAYFEAFSYIGLIAVGFALAVPVLTVIGIVLLISPAVIITALNMRSAHNWFDN